MLTLETEIYSEGNNKIYLETANKLLKYNLPLKFMNMGNSNQIESYFRTLSNNTITRKIIFLFDCDAIDEFNKCDKIKIDKLIPMITPYNHDNKKVKSGIENLFQENLFTDFFYTEEIKVRSDGGSVITKSLDKKRFLEYICHERNNILDFENFRPLFEEFSKQLNN